MIVPDRYEVTVSCSGGPIGSSLHSMIFIRYDEIITFKHLVDGTPQSGGGHDQNSAFILEGLIADIEVTPVGDVVHEPMLDLVSITVEIRYPSDGLTVCGASFSWHGRCPDEWSKVDDLHLLMWAWANHREV